MIVMTKCKKCGKELKVNDKVVEIVRSTIQAFDCGYPALNGTPADASVYYHERCYDKK